jgi:hypothetical protein
MKKGDHSWVTVRGRREGGCESGPGWVVYHAKGRESFGVSIQSLGYQGSPPGFLDEEAICGCGLEKSGEFEITPIHIRREDMEPVAPRHVGWCGDGCVTHEERAEMSASCSQVSRALHMSFTLAPCWWSVARRADLFSVITVKGPFSPGVGGRVLGPDVAETSAPNTSPGGSRASGTRMSPSESTPGAGERLVVRNCARRGHERERALCPSPLPFIFFSMHRKHWGGHEQGRPR